MAQNPHHPTTTPGSNTPGSNTPASNTRGDNTRGDNTRGDNTRGDNKRGDNTRGGDTRGSNKRGDNRGSDTRGGDTRGSNKRGDNTRGGDTRGTTRGTVQGRGRNNDSTRTEDQTRYDGPPIPDTITGKELDHNVAAQLKGLPEKLANRVARHLAAAAAIIDTDPTTAYHHTLAARARASRLAIVREACGEAAYTAGHYTEALAELRAAKRINGHTTHLPIMADCERALGRPDKALTLAKSPAIKNLTPDNKAEMTIVEAGARRDLGQLDADLRTLEAAPLTTNTRAPWVVRLRYTYADTLQQAGRTTEALEWFHRTQAIDPDDTTDAATRAHQLENNPT